MSGLVFIMRVRFETRCCGFSMFGFSSTGRVFFEAQVSWGSNSVTALPGHLLKAWTCLRRCSNRPPGPVWDDSNLKPSKDLALEMLMKW